MFSEKLKHFLKIIFNIKFQISALFVCILIMSALFYSPISKFNESDPQPSILPIYPQKGTTQTATEVIVGLYVKDFPTFNITTNSFVIDGIIWFEFDPYVISLETIEKFSFEKGTIISKSEAKTKLINEKIFARYQIRVGFQADLDYHLFPLEDHRIYLMLTNRFVAPSEVILVSHENNVETSAGIRAINWALKDSHVTYGYLAAVLDKYNPEKTPQYPAVLFSFDFQKTGIKTILILFVPLFIIFFLGFFSLIINLANTKAILSLTVSSITTFIFNLFVIIGMSPAVRYFTIMDKFYSLLIVCIFFIFTFNIYLLYVLEFLSKAKMDEHKKSKILKRLKITRGFLPLALMIILILCTYKFLY